MNQYRDRVRELRRIPARDLAPNPKNWRTHPRAQREALRGVLEEVGFADVALAWINEDGAVELLDGHLRQELTDGDQEIPTVILDLTREEADRVLLTHDFITTMAESNRQALQRLLAGQDEGELQGLMNRIRREAGEISARARDPDVLPDPVPARAQPGDLWQLGRHRLLVGDAGHADNHQRLWGNERAALIFTDPPYGVAYQAEGHEAIRNDGLEGPALTRFLAGTFRPALQYTRPDAAWYIWHASTTRDAFAAAMREVGIAESQYIIWAKPTLVLGRGDYQWQHEPCFYASRAGERPAWHGDRAQSTVWHIALLEAGADVQTSIGPGVILQADDEEIFVTNRIPKGKRLITVGLRAGTSVTLAGPGDHQGDLWQFARDVARAEHPTQKPVALAIRAIENSSRAGERVGDFFLGSGTTLMAAELTGRVCYAMELSPQYADVALRRWEVHTGGTATVDR